MRVRSTAALKCIFHYLFVLTARRVPPSAFLRHFLVFHFIHRFGLCHFPEFYGTCVCSVLRIETEGKWVPTGSLIDRLILYLFLMKWSHIMLRYFLFVISIFSLDLIQIRHCFLAHHSVIYFYWLTPQVRHRSYVRVIWIF